MIGGWSVAAWSVGGLLFAQLLSGVFMTSLEGTIDAHRRMAADEAMGKLVVLPRAATA